jgi:hypothetical protein
MGEEKVAPTAGLKSLLLEKYAEGQVPGVDEPFEVVKRNYDEKGRIISEEITHPEKAKKPKDWKAEPLATPINDEPEKTGIVDRILGRR